MMKYLVIILFSSIFLTSCGESSYELCSDPVQKIAVLLDKNPNDWELSHEYNDNFRYTDMKHKSGVTIRMTHYKRFSWDKWYEDDYEGWEIIKPKSIPLTQTESDVINQAYMDWNNHIINLNKCEVSNMFDSVEVTSDDVEKNKEKTRNDFDY